MWIERKTGLGLTDLALATIVSSGIVLGAIYASADEQPLLYKTMDEYLPIVAGRPAPASRNEARTDKIESIEFAGENTALARVRCSIGVRHFIDFLSLTRIDGEWLIMAKVFHFEEREG